MFSGRRLGVYQIVDLLGAGGMGEVYRARDTKLARDVAIKVLSREFTSDRERLVRFEREARTLASLNHPHIAAIYGIEETDGVSGLILELVEGETLADRLKSGPIGYPESLAIASQIAEALEAAHDRSVIHRDLKPANIKVTPDGVVKVLDFGLAKAVGGDASSADLPNSPTITAVGTRAGVILGTAAYMSPEQARGKPVDRRADLWAFGAVLFEMVTGRQAFEGENISDTIASVLLKEPPWAALPPSTPVALHRLLRRCLEKDRRRRLDSATAARLDLEEALTTPSTPRGTRPLVLPIAAACVALSAAALFLVFRASWQAAGPILPLRLNAELGSGISLADPRWGAATILSPDGAVVAFAGLDDASRPHIYLRPLDQLGATPLSGTNDVENPFFSPDGHWIGFFAEGKLKKVSVTGGGTVTLADAPNSFETRNAGAWGEDGTIVYSYRTPPGWTLRRVPAGGGTSEPVAALVPGEVVQQWPQMLPGGRAVLFTSNDEDAAYDDADLVVQPLPSGTRKVILHGGHYGRYVPSGHLLYVRNATLFAAPFDLGRLEIVGQQVPVIEGVASSPENGGAQFDVSASGTLVYLPQTTASLALYWLDRDGKTTPLRSRLPPWLNPLFAPDGRRLALQIHEQQDDIYVYDWTQETLTRVTADSGNGRKPAWTPDGRRLAFSTSRGGNSADNLFWQRADGTGEAQRLTTSKNVQQPASFHPSGKLLGLEELNPTTSWDLMILPLDGDESSGWNPGVPSVFLATPYAEVLPMFSPDGHWIAYASNETGQWEIYVRPYPGPGEKVRVSNGGGMFPIWSRSKQELLFNTPDSEILVAAYSTPKGSFRVDRPVPWAQGRLVLRPGNRMFDVHPDGERLVFSPATLAGGRSTNDRVTFSLNFLDQLRRIAQQSPR